MDRLDDHIGPNEPRKDLIQGYRWDLAAIVEASNDAIIGTDLEGHVISWNGGAERMYGYSEQEMLGQSIAKIVPPDRVDSFLFRLERLRIGEQITNFETERIGKHGKRLFVSVSVFPVRDESGTPIGIASITRNITALKRAEDRIKGSEERYRAIVEDQTEMICRSLPDTTLTFVNDSYARHFGRPQDELLGEKFIEFLPTKDAREVRTFLDSLTVEEPVATVEHRVTVDGEGERWHQWTDRAIFDEDGTLVEFQSVGRDITERKRAEQALQASEELNRAVLGSLRDQIAVLDKKGEIIAVNDGWSRFADRNSGDRVSLGVNYLEVCRRAVNNHYPDAGRSLEGILSVLEGSTKRYREEYFCPTPRGDRWYLLSVTPLRRPEGGAVVSHIDITERKLAEAALMENREQLRKSRDETQQLAARLIMLQEEERARVAGELHDGIGQSLAIIRNRVDRCTRDSAERPEMLEQLVEISEAVAAAIGEVREVAYGLRPYELDRLGLKNAVESMIEQISDSSPIAITADLDDVDGLLSDEAETNLYRVVQEALHNVIDHAGATMASVAIKMEKAAVHVVVEDNGVGFQETVDGARRGIGLPGIAERARMIGGTVEITSEKHKGTRIDMRVSIKEANVSED